MHHLQHKCELDVKEANNSAPPPHNLSWMRRKLIVVHHLQHKSELDVKEAAAREAQRIKNTEISVARVSSKFN